MVGVDEYNQAFFDSIDQIEIDISNEVDFNNIVQKFDIESTSISNFRYSENLIKRKLKIIKIINTTNVPEDRSE